MPSDLLRKVKKIFNLVFTSICVKVATITKSQLRELRPVALSPFWCL